MYYCPFFSNSHWKLEISYGKKYLHYENCQKPQVSYLYIFKQLIINIYQHSTETTFKSIQTAMATEEKSKLGFIKDIYFLGPAMHHSVEIQSLGHQVKGNKRLITNNEGREVAGIMGRGG